MTLKQLKEHWMSSFLQEEDREVISWFYFALEEILGYSRIDYLLLKEREISPQKVRNFTEVIERIDKGEPVQYIFGKAFFYGLELDVNPDVLIPRPETEELVAWIAKEGHPKGIKVLDVGTGSGCIAVVLARHGFDVTAMDVSAKVLLTAAENAKKNNVSVLTMKDDILNPSKHYPVYDIIVSNPPYIPIGEKNTLDINVREYEPGLALFTDDDPLLFYKSILYFAERKLKASGAIYFETHYRYSKALEEFLREQGWSTKLKKDMQGKYRMLKTWKDER